MKRNKNNSTVKEPLAQSTYTNFNDFTE